MFCAIATTIERCKTEGVVDVLQVVKSLRGQKPGAFTVELLEEERLQGFALRTMSVADSKVSWTLYVM